MSALAGIAYNAANFLGQVYDAPNGLTTGLSQAALINGPANSSDARLLAIAILGYILTYLALIAVIAIIVAGIILIVSGGSENSQSRAKRILLWTSIGLVIIMLAKFLVQFVIVELICKNAGGC